MLIKEITITNPQGLQSKSAALFIQKASGYKASIWIANGERKANGKSLLGVLSLGIGKGTVVSLQVEGEDEAEAASELESYLLSDMGENN
ncbi:MAG: HPr family phosphocarrier protein [Clostridiaceae bacterium]|jgi:phosphotransferase system HPr (HPr) family protein|nr:HPr family phosphocarrier protein [Clostridiaceae bacterium]